MHILHFISQRPGGLINPLLVLSMYIAYSEESGSLMIFIHSYLRTRHIYVKLRMYTAYSEESGGSITSIDSYLRTRRIHESAHYGLNVGLYSSSSHDQRKPDFVQTLEAYTTLPSLAIIPGTLDVNSPKVSIISRLYKSSADINFRIRER